MNIDVAENIDEYTYNKFSIYNTLVLSRISAVNISSNWRILTIDTYDISLIYVELNSGKIYITCNGRGEIHILSNTGEIHIESCNEIHIVQNNGSIKCRKCNKCIIDDNQDLVEIDDARIIDIQKNSGTMEIAAGFSLIIAENRGWVFGEWQNSAIEKNYGEIINDHEQN